MCFGVVLAGLRKHEEYWVFEDPVTEAIAPGYFEVVTNPMDYTTVEKKIEDQVYKEKEEVKPYVCIGLATNLPCSLLFSSLLTLN